MIRSALSSRPAFAPRLGNINPNVATFIWGNAIYPSQVGLTTDQVEAILRSEGINPDIATQAQVMAAWNQVAAGAAAAAGATSTAARLQYQASQWRATPVQAPQGSTPASNVTPSATLINTSRAGGANYVGDSFSLTVIGAPNQTVYVSANGGAKTQYGSTDSSGKFTTSGTWTADVAGNWNQVWYVGDSAAPALVFSVSAAPGSSPAPQPQPIVQPILVQPVGGEPGGIYGPTAAQQVSSSLPKWLLIGGLAAAGYFFFFAGGHR